MTATSENRVKTALISVSDKTGLAEFAKELAANCVKIISSGGTYDALQGLGIKCAKVEDVTGFPEMLDNRVKTLHPRIHAGILARRTKEHLTQLKTRGIEPIDLVVVNLYPFKETVSKKGVAFEDAIENIDLGGHALIRAAAKNHESVGVVVEPQQYKKVIECLGQNGFALSEKMKKELCLEAFEHTALYDSMIASFLHGEYAPKGSFQKKLTLGFEAYGELRYGENPHQKAMLYRSAFGNSKGLFGARQLNGKEMSYNNYLDSDTAIAIARDFKEPCAVIVKHNNPCGVATAKNISEAFSKAYECDSLSAFGGIISLNRKCDLETAKKITSFFNEVVIAPEYDSAALSELNKKPNLRAIELKSTGLENCDPFSFRQVEGGLLVQETDRIIAKAWKNVNGVKANNSALADLEFAWRVCKHVKSNAIVLAKDCATTGIGMGLTSRVDSVELALKKAGVKASGSVLASDAFFPFKDSIELCAKNGIRGIVEPGGSLKDEEVISEAKKRGIALYFTGERHFRH